MTDGVDERRVPGGAAAPATDSGRAAGQVGRDRFARTDDGTADDGTPLVSLERGYVTDSAERGGRRVFQVGDVERRTGALVVDEQGRVLAVGPVELYLGRDIAKAVTRLLQGVRAEELHEVGL